MASSPIRTRRAREERRRDRRRDPAGSRAATPRSTRPFLMGIPGRHGRRVGYPRGAQSGGGGYPPGPHAGGGIPGGTRGWWVSPGAQNTGGGYPPGGHRGGWWVSPGAQNTGGGYPPGPQSGGGGFPPPAGRFDDGGRAPDSRGGALRASAAASTAAAGGPSGAATAAARTGPTAPRPATRRRTSPRRIASSWTTRSRSGAGRRSPWSSALRRELGDVFNALDFRGMQLATINCTLAGDDCLVLMPTGGESRCVTSSPR